MIAIGALAVSLGGLAPAVLRLSGYAQATAQPLRPIRELG